MDDRVNQVDPEWVDSDSALADWIGRWTDSDALAIDTEFVRTDTFYARLGLVQVSDGSACVLVDPIQLNPTPLFELIGNQTITKVLHSGSEDVGIFLHQGKAAPRPLFDTQIAAGLLGLGPSLSYPALLTELLGVEIDKGEQRSDWLQRPLSDAQKHYAANDVYHLLEVYQILHERLERADRLQWAQQDSENLIQAVANNQGTSQLYERFKLAWRLDSYGRMVLWRLLEWREADAIRLDRPRGRVLHDDAILHLALHPPTKLRELNETPRMSPGLVRAIGPTLLDVIGQALDRPSDQHPAAPPRPLGPESKSLMKALKAVVTAKAEELQLSPELLCSRRDYVALIRDKVIPQRLQGWRRSIVGDALLAKLSE